MKVFRDLYINKYDIQELIKSVNDNLPTVWQRAYDREENAQSLGFKAFAFTRLADEKLPSAGISVMYDNNGSWYIPNVVPLEKSTLTHDEYNAILLEFYQECLLPNADDVDITITNDYLSNEEILGDEASKLLKIFSDCANKNTGSSHPCDEERWYDFIIASLAHSDNINLEYLGEILQDQGWSQDQADKLVLDFEQIVRFNNYKAHINVS